MKQIVKISFLTMLMTVVTFGLASARSGRKALLGVQVQTVDRELAKAFDLPVDQGAIVNRLVAGRMTSSSLSTARKSGTRTT